MLNRKNFLAFALFLNCIYFIGVSFLVSRHINQKLDQAPLRSLIQQSTEVVTKDLLLNKEQRNAMLEELLSALSNKSLNTFASKNQLVHVIEKKNEEERAWLGQRRQIPFLRNQLKLENSIGFFLKGGEFYFTYWLDNPPEHFLITQKKSDSTLKMQLSVLDLEVAIVERENMDPPKTLYTSLPDHLAKDLLRQIQFENAQFVPQDLTLSQEKYYVNVFSLMNSPDLKQKLVIIKKIPHFQALSTTDIFISLWTLFCISIVINFFLLKRSRVIDP